MVSDRGRSDGTVLPDITSKGASTKLIIELINYSHRCGLSKSLVAGCWL